LVQSALHLRVANFVEFRWEVRRRLNGVERIDAYEAVDLATVGLTKTEVVDPLLPVENSTCPTLRLELWIDHEVAQELTGANTEARSWLRA
jgi:hypothetical protein